jgi:hypothetical protein
MKITVVEQAGSAQPRVRPPVCLLRVRTRDASGAGFHKRTCGPPPCGYPRRRTVCGHRDGPDLQVGSRVPGDAARRDRAAARERRSSGPRRRRQHHGLAGARQEDAIERRRELFELYIRRHDRIDTWDLVDRSAIHVVGEYLVDKPRDILDELARSAKPMERRTAILSTYAFIRRNQLDDTYRIAETLANDADDLVDKAVGWMLREAGKRDQPRLALFLDAHAATMPRVMLRYSIEKLDKADRDRYLGMARRPKGAPRADG